MFGKIFEQIFDSSIIEDRDAAYVFMSLIILSDEDGTLDITRPALARRINVPPELLDRALDVLEKPDPNSRSAEMDGRRIARLDDHRDWGWFVVNKREYAKRCTREEKRIADRVRIAKKRNELKGVATCRMVSAKVANVAHTDTDTDTDTDKVKSVGRSRKARCSPARMTDDEFVQSLNNNEAYGHIDVGLELRRMDAWLLAHPGRKKTRRFVVSWLNRIEKPMGGGNGGSSKSVVGEFFAKRRAQQAAGAGAGEGPASVRGLLSAPEANPGEAGGLGRDVQRPVPGAIRKGPDDVLP
ncbi:MAG TPA: hypothetical protein PLL10_00055 [Elusimicrobiales bacterium]|nr:hypothetical protein [Elusimicrobiales bacterium]